MLLASPVLAEEFSDASAALAASCRGCHLEEDIQPSSAIPSLTSLSSTTIEQAMLAFQSGQRQSTVMQRIAKGYTPAEVRQLSQYLGQQP